MQDLWVTHGVEPQWASTHRKNPDVEVPGSTTQCATHSWIHPLPVIEAPTILQLQYFQLKWKKFI